MIKISIASYHLDMDCDGLENVILSVTDGTLFGQRTSVFSQAEYLRSKFHFFDKILLHFLLSKKIGSFPNPSKRFCRCQKASKSVEMLREPIKNSRKPKMLFHLDTAKEPSLRNSCQFRTKPK